MGVLREKNYHVPFDQSHNVVSKRVLGSTKRERVDGTKG
jgi:hypothetical protein